MTSKKVVLAVASAGSFLTPFIGSSVNIALPDLGREFSLSAVQLSWVATSYLLAAAVFLVPIGKWADRVGRKRIFTYGIVAFTLTSMLCGLVPNGSWLIAMRVLQGIGGAMIFGTSVAIITSVFPAGERGRALGISVFAVYLGLTLGPVLGGFLTQHLGWRSIFYVNVPLGLIVLALLLWKVREDWLEGDAGPFDWRGTLVYGASAGALIVGFAQLPSVLGGGLIAAALLGLAVFIWLERRLPHPVVNIGLFVQNPAFLFSNLAALINYSATFAVGFLLSLYLQYIQGLSPQAAGVVLVSQPAVMALFSPLAGRLSDRFESRIVASLGMGLTVVGLLWLGFVSGRSALGTVISALIVLGFGFAFFSAPNTNAVMGAVDRRHYGSASAILATMRLTGQMMSMGITLLILSLTVGHQAIHPKNYTQFLSGFHTALFIFSGLCLAGVFASLARGRTLAPPAS